MVFMHPHSPCSQVVIFTLRHDCEAVLWLPWVSGLFNYPLAFYSGCSVKRNAIQYKVSFRPCCCSCCPCCPCLEAAWSLPGHLCHPYPPCHCYIVPPVAAFGHGHCCHPCPPHHRHCCHHIGCHRHCCCCFCCHHCCLSWKCWHCVTSPRPSK